MLLTVSCSHTTTKESSLPLALDISSQDRAFILKKQEQRIRIAGMGNISWSNSGESVAAAGVMIAEWPDKLRLEIQDPLGSVLGLFILNGDSFWWENRKEKHVWSGNSTNPALQKILPFHLAPKTLVQAVLGRPNPAECLEWNQGSQEYSLWLLGNQTQINLQDYAVRFGMQFPTSIEAVKTSGNQKLWKLSWVWQDWQPSIPRGGKVFQIPDDKSVQGFRKEKIL